MDREKIKIAWYFHPTIYRIKNKKYERMQNMILSVFNWNTLDFDYYQNNATADQGGWYELQGLGIGGHAKDNGVGIDIESALPSLPDDARYIGSGELAKGRVCVKRDAKDRGESARPKTMSGPIFGGRLVNLQTLPEKDRVKFNQDRDRHLLNYTGPDFLEVEPVVRVPEDVNYPIPGVPTMLGNPSSTTGSQETSQTIPEATASPVSEIPLALFLVPVITGTSAGYLLGARGSKVGVMLATGLGLLFGVTAGIQLGREYEGYKISTYMNKR